VVAFLGKGRFGPGNASGVQRRLEGQKAWLASWPKRLHAGGVKKKSWWCCIMIL